MRSVLWLARTCLTLVALLSCSRHKAQPSPEASARTWRSSAGAAYPFSPKAPPPVALPAGHGKKVKLQRYIVVDQFGYRPELAKVAILVDPEHGWNGAESYAPGAELEVRRWSDGSAVYRGAPALWNGGKVDDTAGDRGSWFDFSELREPGLYYVFDPKHQVRSHPFEIGADVYRRVLKTAVRAFYFNRANHEKRPPFSCVGQRCWSLGADNLGPGQDHEARSVTARGDGETARDLSGGWWDAGDTNKYVTFAHDAVHQLLTAYEERPRAFTDDFRVPESGNGIPDLIDELSIEIAWLKKMQPEDLGGGALIKMGYVDYGDPTPDQSRLPRYYYPKPCSSATIAVASQFAHAALVLARFPQFAPVVEDLRKRARAAWTFYHANPKDEQCDDGTIKSGDADRSMDEQARLAVVAAVYLFALTGEAQYGQHVEAHYALTEPFQGDRWSLYNQSQGDALLFYASLPNANPEVKAAIVERKRRLAQSVELYRFRPELDLYRAYMRPDSYHWGSNNVRASFGNTNYDLVQHALVPENDRASFLERAAGMLHSFHGVNPMQLVYLTNMYADGAELSADETYHAWFRDQDPKWDNARTSELGPAPGYVTGGPNKQYCAWQDPKQHACATSVVSKQPSEKAYIDSNLGFDPKSPFDKTWELTEPAIYYQASYVRLVSKFVD